MKKLLFILIGVFLFYGIASAQNPFEWNSSGDISTPNSFAKTVGIPDIITKSPWLDIRSYLPVGYVTDGSVDYSTQFQEAATAAAGKTLLIPPGTWKCKFSCITGTSINLQGTLVAPSESDDIITLGTPGTYTVGYHIYGPGTLNGGRYPLRLTGTVLSSFEGFNISGGISSIYAEGQIETSTFKHLNLSGFTQYGFTVGNVDGSGTDYPEMQKCELDHITTAGLAGSTAFLITAGLHSGVQQSSGSNSFKHLIIQGEEVRAFDISYSFNTSIDHISNEVLTLDTANTYSIIYLGQSCGRVTIRNALLSGQANDHTTFKYSINQYDGFLNLYDSSVGSVGAAGTADIYLAGSGGRIENVDVADGTTGIVFAGNARAKSLLINVVDSSNAAITNWADTYTPFIASAPYGMRIGAVYIRRIWAETDDTYAIGEKGNAFKGLVLKDTANGHWYELRITNGAVALTDLGI